MAPTVPMPQRSLQAAQGQASHAVALNPYTMAKDQLKAVAKRMKLDPNIHEVL